MSDPYWHFRRMHPGEMNVDPVEGEFFATEVLDSLTDALVRESVQNSLDARRPDTVLHMRYALSGADGALDGSQRRRRLDGLGVHLDAVRATLSDLPVIARAPLTHLVVEDFGTRGLCGDPHQSEDEEDDAARQRNDFYFFWRNVGRSRKGDTELGRWGLGKTVFPAASRINAFWGLTVRDDDRRRLLLGQCVGRVHRIDGQRYYPYGYYGRFDGDFALPVADDEALDAFSDAFGLARGRGEPGLSVVVPYPALEITAAQLVDSLIHHYFLAMMAGAMTAEVVSEETTVRLDARSLPRIMASGSRADRDFEALLGLARWALDDAAGQRIELATPPAREAPRWDDTRVDAAQLTALRERLDRARPIAVRVPVWVKPADDTPVQSYFDVCIERDESLVRADEHFIRDYITVSGVRANLPRGYRCLVTVRDRPLATLLGDSENPAHTEWQERSRRFKSRYRHGPFTLRYVRNVPRELLRLLTRPAEGRDHGLLRELFALELEQALEFDEAGPPCDQTSGEGAEPAPKPEVEAPNDDTRARLQLDRLDGGFRLTGAPAAGTTPANPVEVEVAYEVRRGNPFSQYHAFDFELDQAPIRVSADHADVIACARNRLVLRPRAGAFRLKVTGFHAARDLRVRVRELDP